MDTKVRQMLNKVPEVTLAFWIIKIMATTVGETGADYLSDTLGLGLVNTSYILGALCVIALIIQIRSNRYIPVIYWLVVVLISVMGTLITDNLVENLGVSLELTSTIFAIALVLVFVVWYASEKTLDVNRITTTRREWFYWAAILFTFALGTSAGDLISEQMGLGYALSAIIFISVIALIFLAYKFLKLNGVLAFWLAYILTRPLGASIGDLLTQDPKDGGLGVSTTIINICFLIVMISLVAYLTKHENQRLRKAS